MTAPRFANRKEWRKLHVGNTTKRDKAPAPTKAPVVTTSAAPSWRPAPVLLDAPAVSCPLCGGAVVPQADERRLYGYCQRCGHDWRDDH